MRTVFKYQLSSVPVTTVEIHGGYTILRVDAQDDQPTIWALVDTDRPLVKRYFRVVGTGHDAGSVTPGDYRGTAICFEGGHVLHVFEVDAP